MVSGSITTENRHGSERRVCKMSDWKKSNIPDGPRNGDKDIDLLELIQGEQQRLITTNHLQDLQAATAVREVHAVCEDARLTR